MGYSFFSLVGLGFILSCGVATPILQPVKHPALSHETLKNPREAEWLPHQIVGSRQYLIHDSSTISATEDASQSRKSETNTFYSLHINQSNDSLLLTAKVDSFITISRFPSTDTSFNIDTTHEFHSTLSPTGQISPLTQDSLSLCTQGITSAAMRTYELFIHYPKRGLRVGDRWTDTVSTTVCHGKIPVLQQAIRNYIVLNFTTWDQQPAVTVRRTVFSILSVDFRKIQNQFHAIGSGESSAVIYANHLTGVLLQSDTESKSTLTVTTTRGVFSFSQILSTHIELHQ